jgi:hypothetical protein
MKSDCKGTAIISKTKLFGNYLISKKFYIASTDRDNYNRAVDILCRISSNSKYISPVPKRHCADVIISYLPVEILMNIIKYLPQKDLFEISKLSMIFMTISREVLFSKKIITVKNLHTVSDVFRNNIKKMRYIGPYEEIYGLYNFIKLEYLEDAGSKYNRYIILASRNGHLEIVKFLASLDSVNPGDQQNRSIISASRNGHLEIVKFLASLDSVNPGDDRN